ncbi:MAG: hypothetical protein ACLFO1_00995 [Spirochaetaceae bacterium]
MGVLPGCSPATLFVGDPYADAIVQYDPAERREIRTLLDDSPQPDRYLALSPTENPATTLQDHLGPRPPEVVFLTAYLADTAISLAPGFTDTRFVILGSGTGRIDGMRLPGGDPAVSRMEDSPNEEPGSNLISVRFDRRAAMTEAGEVTAKHTLALDPPQDAVLFVLDDTSERRREADAFIEGFRRTVRSAQGSASLDERRFDGVPGRDNLRSVFREVSGRYGVFAVFLGTGSPYAVELVIGTGKPFGTENLGLFEPLQERMLFSVDTRLSDALRAYLRATGETSTATDVSEVVATARLVLGPAANRQETTEERANGVNNDSE